MPMPPATTRIDTSSLGRKRSLNRSAAVQWLCTTVHAPAPSRRIARVTTFIAPMWFLKTTIAPPKRAFPTADATGHENHTLERGESNSRQTRVRLSYLSYRISLHTSKSQCEPLEPLEKGVSLNQHCKRRVGARYPYRAV
jgi:hypothetical protein